jgi:hypothetical protein
MLSPEAGSMNVRVTLGCALAACSGGHGTFADVPIEEAWLEDFHASSIAIVAGATQGDALLVYVEPGGTSGSVPVHLGGGRAGIAFDLAWDVEGHDGVVPIDLTEVEAPMVSDVMGTYDGSGSAGALVLGGSRRRLRNDAGAAFYEEHFVAIGLSMFVGYEWLKIRPGGNDG